MSDILVVVSKVKQFIVEKADLNTSSDFIATLSRRVENLCLEAAARAKADKRKTVKGRDLI